MTALGEELRECEIEPRVRARSGPEGGAEARDLGLAALDDDDQGRLAPGAIRGVDVGTAEEDAVLARDGGEIARPDAEEGERGASPPCPAPHEGSASPREAPKRRSEAGEEEPLPRVRADRVSEESAVAARPEPVASVRLFLPDSGRKLGRGGDLVVDDRSVPHRRPENAITRFENGVEQGGKLVPPRSRGARRGTPPRRLSFKTSL